MHLPGSLKSHETGLERLWLQVCASRGTPAPDPSQRAQFLQGLEPEARQTLETVLHLAARGREQPGDLGLVSWAAACTRPTLLSLLHSHSLAFTSAGLFACGLALKEQGWDMQPRLAQLASNPADADTLRALLPAVLPVESDAPESVPKKESGLGCHEEMSLDKPFFPWPNDDGDGQSDGQAPDWNEEPVDDMPAAAAPNLSAALPTRLKRQRPDALPAMSGAASTVRSSDEPRLRLRLFGKAAAHTLEVTPHRRGGDFLGVHVVSIDSAHALGAGGGYAWERKLVIQLTPEEMPAVIVTLMGLTPSVRFGHHGAGRDKFVELRRQEGGLVIVTGEKALSYSVPVTTAGIYYVLDLFCRAMSMGMEEGKPGRSVADVLMLVRSAHGV